jgi:phosphatidylglycerophosphatase A
MTSERSPAGPVQNQEKIQNQNATKWAWAVATFFGAGLLKPGPGTYGSIAAVLLWAAVGVLRHPLPQAMLIVLAVWIALAITVGVPAATIVERESGHTDPGFVVIDEVIGQWIALLFCPVDWRHAVIALVLFRSPFAASSAFPAAGASSSTTWPPDCMLLV